MSRFSNYVSHQFTIFFPVDQSTFGQPVIGASLYERVEVVEVEPEVSAQVGGAGGGCGRRVQAAGVCGGGRAMTTGHWGPSGGGSMRGDKRSAVL